jgi:MHS family proline/betaine transporter-like MFS transporter
VCTYFFLVYLPTYAQRELHLGQAEALLATSACLVLVLVLAPVFGALSDQVGRRGLLITSAAAVVVLTYPALALLSAYPTVWSLLAFQAGFAVVIAAFTGPAPAAMAEVFPTDVRSTSVSIAYNLAVALFGGFAPFIATWLIANTGDTLSPAWYVAAACALSVAMISGLYSHREARVAATN